MRRPERAWPPLIVAAHKSRWLRVRDFAITAAAWMLFASMLNHEFELVADTGLRRLGLGSLFDRLGVADVAMKFDLFLFLEPLAPYLIVVAALLVFLCGFALHTLLRRHWSLGGPRPPPLSLVRQAWHAALAPMARRPGERNRLPRAGLDEGALVDARILLALLNSQDSSTLAAARTLPVAMVEITAAGGYRIERATDGPSCSAARDVSQGEAVREVPTVVASAGSKAGRGV
jgi:hypothetical protein